MNRSIFSEIWHKVFRQGNPLYVVIGINVLIFIILGLLGALSSLRILPAGTSAWLLNWLSLPASFSAFIWKPWTAVTYMFTQVSFFHLLFNVLWLYWLGIIFLSFLNKRQFIFTYLAGGMVGAILYGVSYALVPALREQAMYHVLIGSSASVSAVIFASATLVPNYSIRMLFLGNVPLKYLALAFMVLDLLGVGSTNAGGSIAHLGGALMGFLYVRQLQQGKDWSRILGPRKKKRRLRVVSVKETPAPASAKPTAQTEPNQEIIDRILDKISISGYDSLTQEEKEALFRASKEENT